LTKKGNSQIIFEEEIMAQRNDKTVQAAVPGADADNVKATIRWDVAKMQTTYANVCNVSSTREEFTLLFGINKTWNPEQRELTVDISDRVILNPFAAKRLSLLLRNIVRQHESRFGEIQLEAAEKPEENA
jgi:hypothetical protein